MTQEAIKAKAELLRAYLVESDDRVIGEAIIPCSLHIFLAPSLTMLVSPDCFGSGAREIVLLPGSDPRLRRGPWFLSGGMFDNVMCRI